MNKILAMTLAASTLLAAGCQEPAPPAPADSVPLVEAPMVEAPTVTASADTVAVFDIDRIVKEAGLASLFELKIKMKRDELLQELIKYKDALQAELQKEVKKLGAQDRAKKFAILRQAAEMQLAKAQRKADQALNIHRGAVIMEFREQLKPIARQVARDKGYKMVLLKNDVIVFEFAEELDLTADILASFKDLHPGMLKDAEDAAAKLAADAAKAAEERKVAEAKAAEERKAAEQKAAKARAAAKPAQSPEGGTAPVEGAGGAVKDRPEPKPVAPKPVPAPANGAAQGAPAR